MAIASSGAIDLDEFHVEAGGTSGDTCSMNDADIRGLINVNDGSTNSMDDWYGAANNIEINISAASTVNLKSLFDSNTSGSWAADIDKIANFASGSAYGPTTLPASMGGSLVINNAGTITGAGGTGNGGVGGHAITMNNTTTINNTGTISGGGGAGGNGGAGGAGGNSSVCNNPRFYSGLTTGNAGIFCNQQGYGAACSFTQFNDDDNGPYQGNVTCGNIGTVTGGAGGAGGTSAGVGAGYGVSVSNGGNGSGGASSSAGDGGAGGAKGNGGALGAAGSTGATGSAGANGGATNGAAGSSGSGGGAAGKAVRTAAGTLTYNDSGTTNGATN